MKKSFALLILVFAFCLSAQTTYFGKNKVQYENQDWKVHKTAHFDIYYYKGGDDVASFAAAAAETSIALIETDFKYKLKRRVPVIIYNSHKDFEETNVTSDIIEEFIGGFTESMKSRVVIPFTGSYSDLRHVVNHEIVHAMQFEYLYGGGGTGAIISSLSYDIPLWFIEGSAEFWSREWDKETDMYMRDAVLNDTLIDLMTLSMYSGGFYLYKAGESVLKYLSDRYGREKIIEIYSSMKTTKSFYKSISETAGITLEQLDNDWKYYLKNRYFPLAKSKELSVKNASSILKEFTLTSSYNISPSISPDGNYLAFISEKYGYFDIYMLSVFKPEKKTKILPRTFVRHFESFHIDYDNLNWSKDSKFLIFSARNNNIEKIIIYDVLKRRVFRQIDIKADGVFSPSLNGEMTKIAYTKLVDGKNDICVYDLNSKKESRLTDDIFDDKSPYFLNDSTLLFSSDRNDTGSWNYGNYKLFSINLNDNKLQKIPLTTDVSIGKFSLVNDSTVIFSSYWGDVSNAYTLNLNTYEIKALTDVMTGVFSPTMTGDGKTMAYSYFNKMLMDVMIINNPSENIKDVDFEDEYNDYSEKNSKFNFEKIEGKKPPLKFTVDWAAGAFSYTPGYGFVGLFDLGISDMMGDNSIFVQMEKLSFIGNGYLTVEYWYLKHRIDFALMYLNVQNEYFISNYNSLNYIYNGGGLLFRYPFDRYKRIDYEIDLYKYDVNLNTYYADSIVKTNLFTSVRNSHKVSLVYDNGIWGYYGPVNGDMARIDVGAEFDYLAKDSIGIYRGAYVSIDTRKYYILTPRSQIAVRNGFTATFGPETQYAFLGGSGNLRGYSDDNFYAKNVFFSNNEIRFPLIDKIQFPVYNLAFTNIRGVVFTDFGFAKDNLKDLRLITTDAMLDDLKMGFGAGIRMDIWITILKLDVAKHTDLLVVSTETYYHISFGAEF